jgi:hypothetical protein
MNESMRTYMSTKTLMDEALAAVRKEMCIFRLVLTARTTQRNSLTFSWTHCFHLPF